MADLDRQRIGPPIAPLYLEAIRAPRAEVL